MPRPEIKNDPATIEALKAVTGAEQVRSVAGVDEKSGDAIHAPGYRVHTTGFAGTGKDGGASPMFDFVNEVGQVHQVPAHRVKAALDAAKMTGLKSD